MQLVHVVALVQEEQFEGQATHSSSIPLSKEPTGQLHKSSKTLARTECKQVMQEVALTQAVHFEGHATQF
jgi:hypothetical protein